MKKSLIVLCLTSLFLPLFADDSESTTFDFPISGTLEVISPMGSNDMPKELQIVEFFDAEELLQKAREQQDLERDQNSWLWYLLQSQKPKKEKKNE